MSFLSQTLHRPPASRWLVQISSYRRCFASTSTVNLKYDVFTEQENAKSEDGPLLILHGLFGSKRNWHSLSKAFARQLQRPVYALDLRNHGDSPHGEPMDYSAMASDVLHFCDENSLKDISLLGHSMGGKVAMTLALSPDLPQGLLSRLIVADISPIRGTLSREFQRYIDGMTKIEEEGLKTKKAAFERLAEYEEDKVIRQFLLTNLATTAPGEPLRFRVPLDIINRSIPNLGWFPYEPGEASWDGPTLFVKGSLSNYIQMKYWNLIKQFFPSADLEILEASHWLHAEKPKDFIEVVSRFVN